MDSLLVWIRCEDDGDIFSEGKGLGFVKICDRYEIILVSANDNRCSELSAIVDRFEPFGERLEGFALGYRIYKQDSMGATTMGMDNGPESLLSGSVPDLYVFENAIHLYFRLFETKPDG
jgi:hypothetical protein